MTKIIQNEEKNCDELASLISQKRALSCRLLEKEMNLALKSLALNNSEFKIDMKETNLNKLGKDCISFLLRANVGSRFLPLRECASLGETSRINLAYKLVFNALNPVSTIVFDEIDTSISSSVGVLVSKRIKELSKNSQAIVITHLPQMAAAGDYTLFVSKSSDNTNTTTQVKVLSDEERVYEISKMLSGEEVDNLALENARNLIKNMK